jgi:Fe-S cluster biosynthesis and repair protein YggX
MTRTVFCRKFKEELPGLERPPLPGKRGQDIFDNVSQKAWTAWQAHQTMLINEKHLSLIDPEARTYLIEQMERFFANDDVEQAEGYIAPKSEP